VRQAGRPQDWAGDAQCDTAGEAEVADPFCSGKPDRVLVQQVLIVTKALGQQRDHVANLVDCTRREVLSEPARPDEPVVHPQTSDHLENVEDQLALAEARRHDRHGAELQAAGGQCDEVG
jgi:hypothetical protein